MKVIGYQEVALDILPDNKAAPDDLTDSIELAGLIHEPVVRVQQFQAGEVLDVVCGDRRIGAHRALKRKSIMCKLVEGSDDEVMLWKLSENAHRSELSKEERASQIRQTFELVARMRAAKTPPVPPAQGSPMEHVKRKRGRPARADREARDETARVLGLNPSTVERALAEPKPDATTPPYALPAFGLELGAAWLETVRVYDVGIAFARQRAIALTADLTKLADAIDAGTASGPVARVRRLVDEARALGQRIHGQRPVRLCPYCKASYEPCVACLSAAVMVADQEGQVPDELLSEQPLRIAKGGEFVAMDAADAEPEEGEKMPWET